MAAEVEDDRLTAELSLLQAMYPSEVSFNDNSKEVTFIPETVADIHAKLCLRLPHDYPSASQPEIVTAAVGNDDVRNAVKNIISELPSGEEALDAILSAFSQMAAESRSKSRDHPKEESGLMNEAKDGVVVIVWLHHLLSTAKRKAILAPDDQSVSGISKPGYPGVLLFSGPSRPVQDHVRILRDMNWQAFQVRAELSEVWHFKHGNGVKEVETMAEVVEELGSDGRKKDLFLETMKIK